MGTSSKKVIINKEYNPYILNSVVKRYWYWPLFFVFIFTCFAYVFLRYTKAIFESSSLIQIENTDQAKQIIDVENINSKNNVSSEIELLKSQLLFEKAIDKLNMNVSLFAKGKILTEELYLLSTFNVQPYSLSDSTLCNVPIYVKLENKKVNLSYTFNGIKYAVSGNLNSNIISKHFNIVIKSSNIDEFQISSDANKLYFTFNEKGTLVERLLPGLIITPINLEAKTIQISYQSYNPVLCNDIVRVVTEAFFEYDENLKKQSSDNILFFIESQLDSLSVELKLSKDSLADFQRNSNLPDPEMAGSKLNGDLDKYSDELNITKEELATLRLVSSKLKAEPNRLEIYKILPEMLGKSYESALSNQIEDLHQILEKKEDLLFKLKPENPEIKNINERIDNKIYSIKRSMSVIQERLTDNIRNIQLKIDLLDGEYYKLPAKKMEFNRLKSLQELNEKYYSLLTEKKAQYAISNAGYAPTSRVLSKPFVPETPVSPNRKIIYISFFLFGLLIGIGLIIYKYLTYNEINSMDDLKKLLPDNISFLGGVPTVKKNMEFSQIVVNESSKSRIAEAMRSIRSNLSFVNENAKVIAISSSVSGEGKTFVALNLAGIIALSGKKTIIVDLDLRKPKVHLGFNVKNDNGMSNVIIHHSSLDECIQHSDVKNLDFITAGEVPPNPSELILSDSFKNILETLKSRYDCIIIDNPPVGLVSDGIQVMANADIPIYIFKANYSKRIFAERVIELFEVQQMKSLNVILNGVDSGNRRYGYGYGYGYGQGYYEDDDSERKKRRRKRKNN